MKFFKVAPLLIAGLFVNAANASFVETDWLSTGDGLATLDTVSGIEWLDLSQTVAQSGPTVEARIAQGGDLEGWRLPTYTEVRDMYSRAFENFAARLGVYGSGYFDAVNQAEIDEATQFISLFGYTSSAVAYGTYFNSETGAWTMLGAYANVQLVDYRTDLLTGTVYTNGYGHNGFFLVSDGGVTQSSIQDPSLNANNPDAPVNQVAADVSAPLLGSGALALLGLGGLARRRQ